ncbi:MAG: hypothetical protein Q8O64_05680 [Sideroxyarcus sp.]|nr:hypothetical protein [Sideroxyarcus sp.]
MSLIYILDLCAVAVCAITAALAGALLLIALDSLGRDHHLAVIVAMGAIVVIRLSAIRWHIHLPRFRAYEQ